MKYYTYQLVDPRDGKPFYIGKGKDKRMLAHLKESGHSKKHKRIQEIRDAGLEPLCEVVKHFKSEDAAYRHEMRLIKKIGRSNLTNLTDGGKGAPAWVQGRKDPELELDKVQISLWALMSKKTAGFTLQPVIRFCGACIPIDDVHVDKLREAATKAINKRGLDWSNEIARKEGVKFEFSKIDNIEELYGYRIQKRRASERLSEQREQSA